MRNHHLTANDGTKKFNSLIKNNVMNYYDKL